MAKRLLCFSSVQGYRPDCRVLYQQVSNSVGNFAFAEDIAVARADPLTVLKDIPQRNPALFEDIGPLFIG